MEENFARRLKLLAERTILSTFSDLPRFIAHSAKSHSFKLKIVVGILRYR